MTTVKRERHATRQRGGTQPSPLSREEVLQAGLEVMAAGRLDQLTVRSVAAVLGVTSPAVYHYFDGKEDLLDHLCERVAAQVDLLVDREAFWQDQVVAIILSMDATFARYPGLAARVLSTRRPSPAASRITLAVRDCVIGAGFDPTLADELVVTLHFLFGGWLIGKPPLLLDRPMDRSLLETAIRRVLAGYPGPQPEIPAGSAAWATPDQRFAVGGCCPSPPSGSSEPSTAPSPP